MRNEKKMLYQTKQINELKKQVEDLQKENSFLTSQLESNKRAILLREQSLNIKEKQLAETKIEYDELLMELRQIQDKYKNTIKSATNEKNIFINKMQKQLLQIKKQK